MAKRRGNPNWGKPEPNGPGGFQPSLNSSKSLADSICNPISTLLQLSFASGRVATKNTKVHPRTVFLRRGASKLNQERDRNLRARQEEGIAPAGTEDGLVRDAR